MKNHPMSDPNADIAKVLVSEREIQRRVRELAARVQSDFAGRDLVVVGLLTGTLMFLADLVREIDLPLRLDFIGVSSYRDGTKSRELIFTKELRLDVAGRDVLLVDDILDTGKTLRAVIDKLNGMTPRQIRTCVLLSKKARREYDIPADYVGFEIPDEFVVGYGLDYAEKYRNLRSIGLLKTEFYS
ncbi:MAG TPA: hypoxanthine phosphoribosyltransferase [Verrucomicrobiota bacterium]|nr:hypoxanthine phosphoribosyltransferase [Verrucomicrobiota bacterium]